MTHYSERFTQTADVHAYENVEYAPHSYSSFLWQLERAALERILAGLCQTNPALSLLDFACGSGRILAVAETFAAQSLGIDLSPEMVRVAATKCTRATFAVGDFQSDPALAPEHYDVITAFRFLLNVDPPLRAAALRWLRTRIKSPDGRLIVNVHGNSRSLRHPAILYRRWRRARGKLKDPNQMLAEMSPDETRRLLRDCGFEVVEQHGFGLVPPTLHRTPLAPFARWLDRQAADAALARDCSVNLLFVCRPVESNPGVP